MNYRVWLRSVPGMYEQFITRCDVTANNKEDAIQKAKIQTQRMGFHDRTPDMWKLEAIEEID
jgi:hypothetical protein